LPFGFYPRSPSRYFGPYEIPVDGRWAHLGQMQIRCRASAGTAASTSWGIVTVEHQH